MEDFNTKERFRDMDLNQDGLVDADELFKVAVQQRHSMPHVTK